MKALTKVLKRMRKDSAKRAASEVELQGCMARLRSLFETAKLEIGDMHIPQKYALDVVTAILQEVAEFVSGCVTISCVSSTDILSLYKEVGDNNTFDLGSFEDCGGNIMVALEACMPSDEDLPTAWKVLVHYSHDIV